MEEEKKDPITPEESRETFAKEAEIKKPVEQEVKEILEDMGSTVNEMEKKAIGKKKKHAF